MKFDSVQAILVTQGTDKHSNLIAKFKWIRHPRTDNLIYLFILVSNGIDTQFPKAFDFGLPTYNFGLRTSDYVDMWIFRAVGLKSCRLHILMNLPPPERSLLL